MEKFVTELFTEDIRKQSVAQWGGNVENLKLMGEVENFVYKHNEDYILRVTHSSHRTKELIEGEIEWLNFLNENKIAVCKPIASKNNLFIEIIPSEDSYFIAIAFEIAEGKPIDVKNSEKWNNGFFIKWGQIVGKLHNCSKNFKTNRLNWNEEDVIVNAKSYLPETEVMAIKEYDRLMELFNSFSTEKNSDNFGLIHSDIHSGNFFINNGELFLFDFDDSCFHWIIYDIAVCIFSAVIQMQEDENKEFNTKEFYDNFMKGYLSENYISQLWLNRIPEFLKFRDITLLAFVYKKWEFNDLAEKQKKFFIDVRNRINSNIPIISL